MGNTQKSLKKKLYQFQLSGLKSYRSYLKKEKKNASKSANKKRYLKYIENELKANKKRIAKVSTKL